MKIVNARTAYVINKLLRYGIALLLIVTINFFLPRIMPGDPVILLMGEHNINRDNPAVVNEFRAMYGLDRPLYEQYVRYLLSLARLDFGYSFQKGVSVSDLIRERLFWTVVLMLPSVLAGELLALTLGTIGGFFEGKKPDLLLTTALLLLHTAPAFLVGMLFLNVFGFQLGWFPLGNLYTGHTSGIDFIFDVARHLALPMLVVTVLDVPYSYFVVRNAIVQTGGEYFIFVARAKGLSDMAVAFRHIMKAVLPQFLSVSALGFTFIVSGTMIVEVVFSLNGMGTLIYDAVLYRDYPVIQGAFIVVILVTLALNFIAETLYGVFDPRIRESAIKIHSP